MRNSFAGTIFSLVLLISFILLRNIVGLWTAFIFSLVISTFIFVLYAKKKELCRKEIIMVSLITGILFIIFASIGIVLFPPEQIRDIGDIVMPYLNAITFGICTIIVFMVSGLTSENFLY